MSLPPTDSHLPGSNSVFFRYHFSRDGGFECGTVQVIMIFSLSLASMLKVFGADAKVTLVAGGYGNVLLFACGRNALEGNGKLSYERVLLMKMLFGDTAGKN